jgi:surfeit locus 1 family protein
VREWKTVAMPPQRHLAYALQWFVMALVVLIIFVALNLKKKNEETSR